MLITRFVNNQQIKKFKPLVEIYAVCGWEEKWREGEGWRERSNPLFGWRDERERGEERRESKSTWAHHFVSFM